MSSHLTPYTTCHTTFEDIPIDKDEHSASSQGPLLMPDKTFNLLGLPASVRDIVYKISLSYEYYQRFLYLNQSAEMTGIWLYFRDQSPVPQPALSKVNHQMRQEVLDIFWDMPRICYPYIKQLPVHDLQRLRAFRDGKGRLAPKGTAALKQFSMFWNFWWAEPSKEACPMAIVMKVVFHEGRFPAAHIVLKTSPKTEEPSYNDNFCHMTLVKMGVNAGIWQHKAKRNSARRWTCATFEVGDALRTVMRLHNLLHKHDAGPYYTGEVESIALRRQELSSVVKSDSLVEYR